MVFSLYCKWLFLAFYDRFDIYPPTAFLLFRRLCFSEQCQVQSKIEQEQRVPMYPLPPCMHSLPHSQHPVPEGYLCYSRCIYIGTSQSPRVHKIMDYLWVHSRCCLSSCTSYDKHIGGMQTPLFVCSFVYKQDFFLGCSNLVSNLLFFFLII